MGAQTKIGAMKVANPPMWARLVADAMRGAGGRIPDAARALGVSDRTLFRWLDDDLLRDVPRVANGLGRDGKRGRRAKTEEKKGPKGRKEKTR